MLLATNAGILLVAWVFRQTVAPGWKKGPLIDPASPYAPENAMVLFAFAACAFLDLYLIALAAWRAAAPRAARAAWVPWVALALAAGGAELGVRAWLAVDMVTYFRPHPTLHWVVRPNLKDFDNLTGGGRLTTNADGLREVAVPRAKPPGEVRVLVLGDSSNFGHGVEGDEMWSSVLGARVPTVRVLNGATPGWTTDQAVEFLRTTGAAYAPDLVIAGFNNDPSPDYLRDRDRASSGPIRALNGALFRLETYLLAREVTLSLLRYGNARFTRRAAGEAPVYGTLAESEAKALVRRVSLEDFRQNLATLHGLSPRFVWIDMPINRTEPALVARYVDPTYRQAARELSTKLGFQLVGVDARWQSTREPGLFQDKHVFHPNAAGHRRIAEQVATEVFGVAPVASPGASVAAAGARFGVSSLTPVHAHVLAVLRANPALAATIPGLALTAYASGKEQGDDVARGALDVFFSCEVPAIQMLESRPDARVVGSPGALGRIGVVSRRPTLAALRGARVGLSAGSTPAMDWESWGAGLDATVVDLRTDALFAALQDGTIDAAVTWDPWVEDWLRKDPALRVVAEREFRSVLAVSAPWAGSRPGGAAALARVVEAALREAAKDRPRWDAEVAALSGWPLEVVRAVADRNALLRGEDAPFGWSEADQSGIDRAAAWATRGRVTGAGLVDLGLLGGAR